MTEAEDKRLEPRKKSPTQVDEPKPDDVPLVAPETPKDESMEVEPHGDMDMSANDDLHMADMGDTTNFYEEVNAADDAFMDEHNVDGDSGDHEMVALMDLLQTLGVGVEEANRFSAKVMRISAQPINPSFVEMYGSGNIVHAANHVLRNLNVDGLAAFDLRTAKPNGEAWDFSRRGDRKMALDYVKEKKPSWIIALHSFQPTGRAELL